MESAIILRGVSGESSKGAGCDSESDIIGWCGKLRLFWWAGDSFCWEFWEWRFEEGVEEFEELSVNQG